MVANGAAIVQAVIAGSQTVVWVVEESTYDPSNYLVAAPTNPLSLKPSGTKFAGVMLVVEETTVSGNLILGSIRDVDITVQMDQLNLRLAGGQVVLYRFDGVSFEPYTCEGAPSLFSLDTKTLNATICEGGLYSLFIEDLALDLEVESQVVSTLGEVLGPAQQLSSEVVGSCCCVT